jgi:divalent metal cation (Fe/Co/Zn/Cd) transporter
LTPRSARAARSPLPSRQRERSWRPLLLDEGSSLRAWVCSYLSLALLVGVGAYAAFGWAWADPAGALLMLPVILWQGWETLEEAREDED